MKDRLTSLLWLGLLLAAALQIGMAVHRAGSFQTRDVAVKAEEHRFVSAARAGLVTRLLAAFRLH